ncbi:VWA-like domain-containing protein [Clostridium massiliamazoniense]|uniref:vWA domain-containing protein n=1 Tax=Clostridium massiliamazoniense TaxID=1347366 RepID=UPI0006D762A9|nr:VWA-like domain-containing protein [Clostridium massiliamazoniense]
MSFEESRRVLCSEAFEIAEGTKPLSDKFRKDFFKLVESLTIKLYERESGFFGQFLVQVRRDIDFTISWPISTVPGKGEFIMSFNPSTFLDNSEVEMEALLKHEIYHIMMNHYERANVLKNKYSKLAVSIAMDISINQYIKDLPPYCRRLYDVNAEFGLELDENMTMEAYAHKIEEVIRIRAKKHEPIISNDASVIKDGIEQESAHDGWESAGFNLDSTKALTRKVAINAFKGGAPKDIAKAMDLMKEKGEISWQEILRSLISNTKRGYRKTITRKDRRMPNRLDLRGRLANHIPKILVAIDISASMTDAEVEKIIIEILSMARAKDAEITVLECDDEIRRVYDLKTPKDMKPRSKKNGSTKFSPVFRYIKDNNLRDYILVYFTDGVGEKELETRPINIKTIWVLTDKEEELSLERPFGIIKRLEREEVEKVESSLDILRENINYWGRC